MPTLGADITANLGTAFGNTGVFTMSYVPSADNPGGTLDSVHFYLVDVGNDDYRVGVYVGGSDGDPEDATLIYDSGQLDGAGLSGWTTITAGGESITASETLWVGIVAQASLTRYRTPDSENGDYADALRRFNHTLGDALPATSPVSTVSNAYSMKSYITYTASGGGAANPWYHYANQG